MARKNFVIMLSDDERKLIQEEALKRGISAGTLIRKCVLKECCGTSATDNEPMHGANAGGELRIQGLTKEYLDELDRKAALFGCTRQAYAKQVLNDTPPVVCNLGFNVGEDFKGMAKEMGILNKTNTGILRIIEMPGNIFTLKDRQDILENSRKMLEATEDMQKRVWQMQLAVRIAAPKAAREEVRRILCKKTEKQKAKKPDKAENKQ